MKKLILILILILAPRLAFSQIELFIKFSPQRVFHPVTALIPIALEYKFKSISIEYEHGFKINSFMMNWNVGKLDMSYFRSQLQLRYYLNPKNDYNQFFGFNFSYLPLTYSKHNDWYIKNQNRYR